MYEKIYKDNVIKLHREIYSIHDNYRDDILFLNQKIDCLNRKIDRLNHTILTMKSEADSREKYIKLLEYNRKIV